MQLNNLVKKIIEILGNHNFLKIKGDQYSFPAIPSKGLEPLKNLQTILKATKNPLIHIRSCDYKNSDQLLERLHEYKNLIDVLVVYGNNVTRKEVISPSQAIKILKDAGFRVGGVFNPTPIIRDLQSELKFLALKQQAGADFFITQCSYNYQRIADFLRTHPLIVPTYLNMGFWTKEAKLEQYGIDSKQFLSSSLKEVIEFYNRVKNTENVWGWYFCGNNLAQVQTEICPIF